MAAMLGVASVFQPSMSGLDTTWAVLAVLWALALVASYELSARRAASRPPATSAEPSSASP